MNDVVIVPCYERPEYTRLCLTYLAQARGVHDKEVWLCQDQHIGDDRDKTTWSQISNVSFGYANFPGKFSYHVHEPHDTYGNSTNLVDSLRAAYESGAERIFLVEDDIIVAPDIFEWHEAVFEHADPFVSCATALNKSAHFQINGPQAIDEEFMDPAAYIRLAGPYSSHAAAFKRNNLKEVLDSLPAEPKWISGYEQDLHIQRMMGCKVFKNRGSVWPYVPRAYNVGVYSYHINTGRKLFGTLEEKVIALNEIIKSPQKLREMAMNNNAVTPPPVDWPVRKGPVHEIRKFR